ncbi:MAG: DUF1840 family protein [Burkholderiaceae bacterium]
MIYSFKSRATGTLHMNNEIAELLLQAIGHDAGAKGVITVEQLPGAIQTLRDMTTPDATVKTGRNPAEIASLAQHIGPAIDLLEQSMAARKPVTWGV